MNKNNNATYQLVLMASLIALEIVLTRFLSIQTPIMRIGFGFLPVAILAMLFGPLWAGACYVIGDILGMFIFPSGAYFPGFTFSALVTGVLYGLILYKKPVNVFRAFLAAFTVLAIVTVGLNTLWLYIIFDKAFLGILMPRLVEALIMLVVQTITIYGAYSLLSKIPFTKAQMVEQSKA